MRPIIVCMAIELFIGIFVALLVWLKNFYYLIKFPDKYKIIKVNIQRDNLDFLDNYMYDSSFNFLAVDYLFAIIEYENNSISKKTFYNIFGGNITIQGQDNEIISRYTYMYYCLATIPILLVILISLFGGLFFLYRIYLFNYRAWLAISAIIWSIVGFYLPILLKHLISEFKNELQKIEEENNGNINS